MNQSSANLYVYRIYAHIRLLMLRELVKESISHAYVHGNGVYGTS